MRIVAGAFRGRRLHSPRSDKIRPTTDRVREAVFSIIAAYLPEAGVLDLFAGTGALGLEALSRGACRAVFVDQSPEAIRLIRANVALCGVQEKVKVLHGSIDQVIRRLAGEGELFDVIFLDPPYGKGYVEKTLGRLGEIARCGALVIAEHSVKDDLPRHWAGWVRTGERRYGDTMISFYERELPC
ncbi:16S rRNA (guanine(966)-N(2))-methyltransferase RsmD [Desulforhabdus amnigena]|jgi:16S rRNA (guanine(966)-N(2))-methyltransferase RsmD|uniref:rRNA methyltransferase n=1 Tax=Desulforhabdus amnigena TaxID=40218 RepID=A0A9W6LAG1_9BACT|nr:16S rRNA (guanine(966)-N(2))-methyltransferase RsmD [Desulforhabdus amnigena]GLI35806.1 rRNA methyltransferase [Desulforhabdus amnigena]